MSDRVEKTKKTGGFDGIQSQTSVSLCYYFQKTVIKNKFFVGCGHAHGMSYCVNRNTVYTGFIKAMGKVVELNCQP